MGIGISEILIALGVIVVIAAVARLLSGPGISVWGWLAIVGVSALVSAAVTMAVVRVTGSEAKPSAPPSAWTTDTHERIRETRILLDALQVAIDEYRNRHPENHFPPEDADDFGYTAELTDALAEAKLYFAEDRYLSPHPLHGRHAGPVLADSWGEALKYRVWAGKQDRTGARNPRTFDLWSAGPDGIFDTDDDIGNWPSR